MPEYDETDIEIDETEDEGVRGARKAQRATEAENKRLREELAQAAADRRELAATKAGLDTSDKTTAFFLKHYDGDPTAEAMKAAAIEAGVLPEVDATAQASADGQAQMASAFQGGEHNALGTMRIGPVHQQAEVPAEQAEMWSEFEKIVKSGNSVQHFREAADVLRRNGHDLSGITDREPMPGAGAAQTAPIQGRPV